MKELQSRSILLTFRLLISFFIFSLCRASFYMLNLADFGGNSFLDITWSFLWGIWFDVVPVFYYNLPLIFLHTLPHPWWHKPTFQKILLYIFFFTNAVATIQNIGDAAYFPFNKKRTGAEILQISHDWDVSQVYTYVTDFWYLFPIAFSILCAAAFLWKKATKNTCLFPPSKQDSLRTTWKPWFFHLLGWTFLTVLGLRGGWGLIPLRTFDAGKYVGTTLVPLTVSSPFQLICTIENTPPPSFRFMPTQEAERWIPSEQLPHKVPFRKKNVVIIIVESLGKEYLGFYNQGTGYTPFLDSLATQSFTFENGFANGTTSMDAPPAIFSGIPQLVEESYIVSPFNTNTPQSIGSILTRAGYASSSFYHGGKNGTMGFDNFVSSSGMGTYSGLDEYPYKEDYDGKWGIFDEPYLQFYADELSKKEQPFVSAVFTLSSHHPYTLPKKYQHLFPDGTMPIHRSIRYVDMALQKFFQKAKKMPWYGNTLFVITADHTSDSDNPAYQTILGRYRIPFFLFCPSDNTLKGTSTKVMQQSLLLPSILDYLHYDKPFFHLGPSAFDTTADTYALLYTGSHYYLVRGHYAASLSPEGKCDMYDAQADPYFHHPLPDDLRKKEMERTLKACLQVGLERLKTNTFGTVSNK